MIELVKNQDIIKPMSEMQPLEVCVVVDGFYKNEIVMRTSASDQFGVMNLSDPRTNNFWANSCCAIKVRELREGEVYYLRLSK